MPGRKRPLLVDVHVRLFAEDVDYLHKLADTTGVPWQVDLRQRLRASCRGEARELIVLKEKR